MQNARNVDATGALRPIEQGYFHSEKVQPHVEFALEDIRGIAEWGGGGHIVFELSRQVKQNAMPMNVREAMARVSSGALFLFIGRSGRPGAGSLFMNFVAAADAVYIRALTTHFVRAEITKGRRDCPRSGVPVHPPDSERGFAKGNARFQLAAALFELVSRDPSYSIDGVKGDPERPWQRVNPYQPGKLVDKDTLFAGAEVFAANTGRSVAVRDCCVDTLRADTLHMTSRLEEPVAPQGWVARKGR